MPKSKLTDTERFLSYVNKTDTCWLWTRSINIQTGYGQFSHHSRLVSAHRYSYELVKGEIPKGLELDHLCRIRHCVNPSHLEAVTRSVNMLRAMPYRKIKELSTHCPHGHPFDETNTLYKKTRNRTVGGEQYTYRVCRKCRVISNMATARRHQVKIKSVMGKLCPNCNNTFIVGPRRKDIVYCSVDCQKASKLNKQRIRRTRFIDSE
jgi:hypothetical protein